jgi:protein gp37
LSQQSSIEWTDASWNPVTGCTKVSPGCDNCYAERFAERWRGIDGHPYRQGFDLKLWPTRLKLPLTWKKPNLIFVNSMSDLFHPDVPVEFVERVFETMERADWHVFQVLTKRPHRMRKICNDIIRKELANVWLGTSVENANYKWRIEVLRETRAAVRFLSIEPLVGDVGTLDLDEIHWVIVGGESGPGCRPVDVDWVRSIREQCLDQRVPFFFKQWGGVRKKGNGRVLDGQTWDALPHSKRECCL